MVLAVSSGTALPPDFSPDRTKGLGLRIVMMLVQQIRGELKIDRPTGTFAVEFPESKPAIGSVRRHAPDADRR